MVYIVMAYIVMAYMAYVGMAYSDGIYSYGLTEVRRIAVAMAWLTLSYNAGTWGRYRGWRCSSRIDSLRFINTPFFYK